MLPMRFSVSWLPKPKRRLGDSVIYGFAVLLGVLIGYLLGGRISRLSSLRFRALYLVPIALLIQLLIFPLFTSEPLLPVGTVPLHILSYALVFLFLALNLRVRPLAVLGAGAVANLAAILANGGRMPASATALERAGLIQTAERLTTSGEHGNVLLMSESTTLNVLGDWLYLPSWFPGATAFSLGDLLIMIGLAYLIVKGMRSP